MVKKYLITLLFLVSFSLPLIAKEFQDFVVIIPSYNNKRWYRKNLTSVLNQNYLHYSVYYIDDASEDGTASLVERYLAKYDTHKRVTLIKNDHRRGQLANIYSVVHSLKNDDAIIVILDGDDWLIDERVLLFLNKEYREHDLWISYGQFKRYAPSSKKLNNSLGTARSVPRSIIEGQQFRSYPWVFTHLRTYKVWLFKLIKLIDLLYDNYFYLAATDLAQMFPMLEMAGFHQKCIQKPLYIYNVVNSERTNSKLQRLMEAKIRVLPCYERLYCQNPLAKEISRSSRCDVDTKNLIENDYSEYSLFSTGHKEYAEDEIEKIKKFMDSSHADICYVDAELVDHYDLWLWPSFYATGKKRSEDKVVRKSIISEEVYPSWTLQKRFQITSKNSFYYIPLKGHM